MPGKKRRGRGEGEIEKLPGGKYRARVSRTHLDPKTGKKRRVRTSKSFASKADAVDWRNAKLRAGSAVAGTLGDWLTEWLGYRKPDVAPQTYRFDRHRVNRWLMPRLGSTRLRDLDATRIVAMLAGMAADGASDAEREAAGAVLRKALNAAVVYDRLPSSPMDRVRLPSPKRPERRVLTPDEAARLATTADTRGSGWWVRLWLDTGLRPAELLALHWDDVDLDAGTVTIRRALDAATHTIKTPKTKRSRRTLDLGPSTVAALRQAPRPAPIFLPSALGTYTRQNAFWRDTWRPLTAAADLAWLPPYSVRHSTASLLLSRGINVLIVSRRLGHESITTTLRVYGHQLPDDQKQAAGVMGDILGPFVGS